MKKLMILGAGTYQLPIIKKAQARGLHTIVISPNGPYPGLNIADKAYHIDVRDESTILKIAMAEQIDGITTDQTDMAMTSVAYVAEKMGLPGIGYECAKLFTDKYQMRYKSELLGLPTIKHRKVSTIHEAAKFLIECNGNIMIKPTDNQGSRGVFKIESIVDLEKYFEKSKSFSKSGNVIAEQYIDGDEYELDSLVIDGNEHTLMCGDIVLFNLPGIFASKTRMYPSCRDPEIVTKLYDLNRKTIEGFGLKNGLTHSEYKVDKNGTPYLIEAAARGGGAFVSSDITLLQTGLDTAEYLIDAALGESLDHLTIGNALCHCGTLSFYLPEGVVLSLDGVEEAKTLPFVHGNLLDDIYIGMKTESFSDKTARFISVISAETREELERNFEIFRNTVRIQVETSEGISGPIWG